MKAMIAAQERTNELLALLVERGLQAPVIPVIQSQNTEAEVVNLRKFTTDRPSKKLQMALDWLSANPGNLDASSRDLESVIGVSHMTIYKAQQILKGD